MDVARPSRSQFNRPAAQRRRPLSPEPPVAGTMLARSALRSALAARAAAAAVAQVRHRLFFTPPTRPLGLTSRNPDKRS